jgi:hypothetical protein
LRNFILFGDFKYNFEQNIDMSGNETDNENLENRLIKIQHIYEKFSEYILQFKKHYSNLEEHEP